MSTAEVDAWMSAYDNPQKAVVQRVRDVLMGAHVESKADELRAIVAAWFALKGGSAA